MSRASKITFAASCAFTTATIIGVYWLKEMEFTTRRAGIARDSVKRQENILELQRQEALRRELEVGETIIETTPGKSVAGIARNMGSQGTTAMTGAS
ncbi:hypothetical protein BC832DRAFT_123345 [Gaertneriomyces semiglobifer]|nr:hypothetical protein BC832DRAFT_123345 [Gaertneriomyces semiglobifer]